jgi:hypothetical protein
LLFRFLDKFEFGFDNLSLLSSVNLMQLIMIINGNCCPRRPDRVWDSPNLLSNGYRGLFSPGLKGPGREADHSPTASAEVRKMWIYASTPPYAFMA